MSTTALKNNYPLATFDPSAIDLKKCLNDCKHQLFQQVMSWGNLGQRIQLKGLDSYVLQSIYTQAIEPLQTVMGATVDRILVRSSFAEQLRDRLQTQVILLHGALSVTRWQKEREQVCEKIQVLTASEAFATNLLWALDILREDDPMAANDYVVTVLNRITINEKRRLSSRFREIGVDFSVATNSLKQLADSGKRYDVINLAGTHLHGDPAEVESWLGVVSQRLLKDQGYLLLDVVNTDYHKNNDFISTICGWQGISEEIFEILLAKYSLSIKRKEHTLHQRFTVYLLEKLA